MNKPTELFFEATLRLVVAFLIKQGFEEDGEPFEFHFIGDDPCGIIEVSDIFFTMTEIYLDMFYNVPKGIIIKHYDYNMSSHNKINYKSYLMNLGLLKNE